MPRSLPITLELITPAYAGGADVAKTDGLRPPTLKALLRFWWRTLHPEMPPDDLFKAEEKIFGSTGVGQGIRIVPLSPIQPNVDDNAPQYNVHDGDSLFFMAFGALTDQNRTRRERIAASTGYRAVRYKFKLVASVKCTDREWTEVHHAVWLLTTFGGFGSRSRRGFGGLQVFGIIPGMPDIGACTTAEAVTDAILRGLSLVFPTLQAGQLARGLGHHASFSARTSLAIGPCSVRQAARGRTPEKPGWEVALDAAGRTYADLRRLLGTTYEHAKNGQEVGPDFDRTVKYLKLAGPLPTNQPTFGSYFGLPHNYHFSSSGQRCYYEVFTPKDVVNARTGRPPKHGAGRRASPIFFKVIRIANSQYVPIVLFLPSRNLGAGYEVWLVDEGSGGAWPLSQAPDTAVGMLFGNKSNIPRWLPPSTTLVHRPFVGYRGLANWRVAQFTTSGWEIRP